MRLRFLILPLLVFGAGPALAAPPDMLEAFDGAPETVLKRWAISGGLDPAVRASRVQFVHAADGLPLLRIAVRPGDALDPPEGLVACDARGSNAAALESAGRPVGSERVEIQLRSDRATGAGEVVRFGMPTWYRFAFRIPADNPRDEPAAGREACRTVIHQVKQDSARDGAPCGASPFFKVEARPVRAGVEIFAQVSSGEACATPPRVRRVRLCPVTRGLGTWVDMRVRLRPAHDGTGELDLWLDGVACGSYRGPMADARDGLRRAGVPYINAQPRFGIYRDRRNEAQAIELRDIALWTSDPGDDPAWRRQR